MPFKFQQYIRFLSNRHVSQAYNIALSQTLRVLYTTNSTTRALLEIQNMVNTFVEHGFQDPRLYKMILNFCTIDTFPGIGFNMVELCSYYKFLHLGMVRNVRYPLRHRMHSLWDKYRLWFITEYIYKNRMVK